MWDMLGLQSMLWITFQTSEKLQFKLLLQGREGEHRVRRSCDLQALKTVLITLRRGPNVPFLSRSLRVISVQARYTALCCSRGKCGRKMLRICCFLEVLLYINGMSNAMQFLPYLSRAYILFLCHFCKWDLAKRSFSFLLITAILLWTFCESSCPSCGGTVGAWSVKFESTWQTGTRPSSMTDSLRWCWGRWTHPLAGLGKKATLLDSKK